MPNGWKPAFGARIENGGVQFSVWAPNGTMMGLQLDDGHTSRVLEMECGKDGVFSLFVPGIGAGARYAFKLNGEFATPDPYSRYQPDGVHGPSEVIDPEAYQWRDADWRGIDGDDLVVYELHVGTMTPEGTFASLIPQLSELKGLGVTAIELMPVAQCPGRWELGIRRCRSLRAVQRIWHAGRVPAAGGRGA